MVRTPFGPRIGQTLGKEVTAALTRIEKKPLSGARCGFRANELQGIRRMPIAGFPKHLIFYRPGEEEIRILRVVHGAGDLENLLCPFDGH